MSSAQNIKKLRYRLCSVLTVNGSGPPIFQTKSSANIRVNLRAVSCRGCLVFIKLVRSQQTADLLSHAWKLLQKKSLSQILLLAPDSLDLNPLDLWFPEQQRGTSMPNILMSNKCGSFRCGNHLVETLKTMTKFLQS